MSDLSGDEWKYVKDEARPKTRAELQRKIDSDYAASRISLDQWRRGTDHLSGCNAQGGPMETVRPSAASG